MTAYRLAVYAIEVGWEDASAWRRYAVTRTIAGQLYRAVGSIGANLAEGYSRSSGRDRVRHLEYALGSAREAIVWYRAARPIIDPATLADRLDALVQTSRLLMTAILAERDRLVRKRDR